MLISIFSPKGGTGCSVTSAVFAHCLSESAETLLIDACQGDQHVIAGVDSAQYSFDDWCTSATPTCESLENISTIVDHNLRLVTSAGASVSHHLLPFETRSVLTDQICSFSGHCVVDLGQRSDAFAHDIVQASDVVVMVVRQSYQHLYGATHHPILSHVDVCVVVEESGRSISVKQMIDTLSLSCVIELEERRDFARTIDAGVLMQRMPNQLRAPIAAFVNDALEDAVQTHDVFDDLSARNDSSFWNDTHKENYLSSLYKRSAVSLLKRDIS